MDMFCDPHLHDRAALAAGCVAAPQQGHAFGTRAPQQYGDACEQWLFVQATTEF